MKLDHIAIIMDGNGRWATNKGLKRIEGHKKGIETFEKIVENTIEFNIPYLTVYAFSTENWKRPKLEVNAILNMFQHYLITKKEYMNNQGVKLNILGKRDNLPTKLLNIITEVEKYTRNNKKLTLNIAFNYGAREEIIQAINGILSEKYDSVDENIFNKYLYTKDIPDPDLVIRTSNEYRISNFLLWQIAYSEIYISDVNWPDFNKDEYKKAIENYRNRNRRYGGINVK